jgi:hypothetical protein
MAVPRNPENNCEKEKVGAGDLQDTFELHAYPLQLTILTQQPCQLSADNRLRRICLQSDGSNLI